MLLLKDLISLSLDSPYGLNLVRLRMRLPHLTFNESDYKTSYFCVVCIADNICDIPFAQMVNYFSLNKISCKINHKYLSEAEIGSFAKNNIWTKIVN